MQRDLYPRLVQDVQLMINELGNVTVLWEELWLSTLQDLHTGDISSVNKASVVYYDDLFPYAFLWPRVY